MLFHTGRKHAAGRKPGRFASLKNLVQAAREFKVRALTLLWGPPAQVVPVIVEADRRKGSRRR